MKLGGVGKTVEIDECICSCRKYRKGRRVGKEDMLIVGLFEVPKPEVVVEDESVLRFVKWKEKRRQEKEEKKKAEAKKPKQNKQKPRRAFKRTTKGFSVISGLDVDFPLIANKNAEPVADLVRVNPELQRVERATQALFSQARCGARRKALFFLVERRTREVLEALIKANVLEGSSIMTDEWAAYGRLADSGFQHDAVCHKYHFSRFVVDGNVVRRVTTNHVEREWVELRKRIRNMPKERATENLSLETYRLYHLVGDHGTQVETVFAHIALNATNVEAEQDDDLQTSSSVEQEGVEEATTSSTAEGAERNATAMANTATVCQPAHEGFSFLI